MQKKLAVLFFVILIFLLLLTGVWYMFIGRNQPKKVISKTIVQENITLTYEYKESNVWTYQVKGELPNPCHKATVEAQVMESYPEQVIVNVNIENNQTSDVVCIQVIQQLNLSGEFNASEKATVSLKVNN